MDHDYKYEVAFSFLQQDESLAQILNDLLQDRMSTFIHSERQPEIMDSRLYVRLLELDRRNHFDRKFRELKKIEFHFSLNESDQYGWRATKGDKKFFSTKELTDFALRMILDEIADFRLRKSD